jgi:hypothetical protein
MPHATRKRRAKRKTRIIANETGATLSWRNYKPVWAAAAEFPNRRRLYCWKYEDVRFAGTHLGGEYALYLEESIVGGDYFGTPPIYEVLGVTKSELVDAAKTLLATMELMGH